jgi:hypothetical protein
MRFLFNLIHVYPAQFNDIQPMSVVCHFTLSLSASHFRSWTTRESGISDFDFVCKRVATKYVEEDIPRVISTKSFILLYYGNRLLWPIHEGLDEIEVNCYLKPERKPGISKVQYTNYPYNMNAGVSAGNTPIQLSSQSPSSRTNSLTDEQSG